MTDGGTGGWAGTEVLLIVSVDVECDKGSRWEPHDPRAFRSVTVGVGERLQPLCERHGVRPTYLLSPEVMRDEASVGVLNGLRERAELGTHFHAEQMDPAAPTPSGPGEYQCRYPTERESREMAVLRDLYVAAFGAAPRSFRAGRFGAGPRTLRCLEDLGYENDSSVTPHLRWGEVVGELDFTAAPEQPYFPSIVALAQQGSSRVLELPVSIVASPIGDWVRSRVLLENSRGLVKRALRRALRPEWLRPTSTDVPTMARVCRTLVDRHRHQGVVVLNLFLHAGEVVEGCTPYSRDAAAARAILDRLDGILGVLRGWGASGVTMAEAGERWRARAAGVRAA